MASRALCSRRASDVSNSEVALIVDRNIEDLQANAQALRGGGYEVVEAVAFDRARTLLSWLKPGLLVADVRLGAYNGLHLALLQRKEGKASIVTSWHSDPVLQSDARMLDCPYVLKPVDPHSLLVVAADVLSLNAGRTTVTEQRKWPRTWTTGDVALVLDHAHATVMDLSYGGCRLRFPVGVEVCLSSSYRTAIPASEATIEAIPVWKESAPRADLYGISVRGDRGAVRAWRNFVDRHAAPE